MIGVLAFKATRQDYITNDNELLNNEKPKAEYTEGNNNPMMIPS